MATVPTLTLNNGVEIPQLGFGVFQIPPEETAAATRTALEIGYRHIDTAQMYGNEKEVGQAVRESGLDRSEVFVTSKLNNNRLDRDDMLRSFDRSLEALGFDYLDLFLIHWPLPAVSDYVAALEGDGGDLRRRPREARSASPTSSRTTCATLFDASEVRPAVNQIEVHPFLTQDELRAFDAEHEIVTEAWAPIARGKVNDDAVIRGVAEQVGRTPGAGRPALARPARRRRLPEVGHPQPRRGELRHLRLRARRGRDGGDHRASTAAQRTGPDPDEFN